MDRKKEIIKASEIFSEYEYNQIDFENGFYKGANWADQNPKNHWISVKDDLPCNHEEFIKTGGHYLKETIEFITIDEYDVITENGNGNTVRDLVIGCKFQNYQKNRRIML